MKDFKKLNSKFGSLLSITSEERLVWSLNIKRCLNLLRKEELSDEDIVDALISLHLVLEVSLNNFFRDLLPYRLNNIENFKIIEHLDNISFIDKTKMFIYTSDFDFKEDDSNEVKRYDNLIERLIEFARVRNVLLHGHTVMSVQNFEGKNAISKARGVISQKTLERQVDIFKYVIDGMRFYVERLKSHEPEKLLALSFLDYQSFPDKYKNRSSLT